MGKMSLSINYLNIQTKINNILIMFSKVKICKNYSKHLIFLRLQKITIQKVLLIYLKHTHIIILFNHKIIIKI